MSRRLVLLATLLGSALLSGRAWAGGQDDTPLPYETLRLTFKPAAAPVPALKYRLLPDVRDLRPGNAALVYYRAYAPDQSTHLRPEMLKLIDAWAEDPRKTPPNELRWVMDYWPLRQIDQAAQRTYVNWEMEERLRQEGFLMRVPDVQSLRPYATLLALRARFQCADGHPDQAVQTLQTGLTFGRHVGDGPMFLQAMVGLDITQRMLDQVEVVLQSPGAPNLYWALSQLPQPLFDLRKPIEGERLMLDSLLRELGAGAERRVMSQAEAQALVDRLVATLRNFGFVQARHDWQSRLGWAVLAAQSYPQARAHLLEHGWTAAQVETMPVLQAGLLYEVFNYEQHSDDLLKWAGLPDWQARPGLARAEERLKAVKASGTGSILAVLLLPSTLRPRDTVARADRRVAALRCVEALRLYAAAHGRLPDKLADVKEVPVPIDPMTGAAFRYALDGDRAVLQGPAPQGTGAAHLMLRYELTLRRN
jgi:hypothetical protein